MSNMAVGAALQGFMQGATDFAKLYMMLQQMDAEKQYRNKILNLEEQKAKRENEKWALTKETIQTQSEQKKKLFDLASGIDWSNPSEARRQLGQAAFLDPEATKIALEALPKEREPRYAVKQAGNTIFVFRDGKVINKVTVPAQEDPNKILKEQKLLADVAIQYQRIGKEYINFAKSMIVNNPNVFGNIVSVDDLNNPVNIELITQKLEEYANKYPEQKPTVDKLKDLIHTGFQYIYKADGLFKGKTLDQPTPKPNSKPKTNEGNFYMKNILGSFDE